MMADTSTYSIAAVCAINGWRTWLHVLKATPIRTRFRECQYFVLIHTVEICWHNSLYACSQGSLTVIRGCGPTFNFVCMGSVVTYYCKLFLWLSSLDLGLSSTSLWCTLLQPAWLPSFWLTHVITYNKLIGLLPSETPPSKNTLNGTCRGYLFSLVYGMHRSDFIASADYSHIKVSGNELALTSSHSYWIELSPTLIFSQICCTTRSVPCRHSWLCTLVRDWINMLKLYLSSSVQFYTYLSTFLDY